MSRDVIPLILSHLECKNILECSTINGDFAFVIQDESFWRDRTITLYGTDPIELKPQGVTFKSQHIYIQRANSEMAARDGRIDALSCKRISSDNIKHALEGRQLETIKWLESKVLYYSSITDVIKGGVEIIKHYINKGYNYDNYAYIAIENGDMETFQWFIQKGHVVNDLDFTQCLRHKKIKMASWIRDNYKVYADVKSLVIDDCAEGLRWLNEKLDPDLHHSVIYHDSKNIFLWLMERNEIDLDMAEELAVEEESFGILQCMLDKGVLTEKYFYLKEYLYTPYKTRLDWLYMNHILDSKRATEFACNSSDDAIIEWLYNHHVICYRTLMEKLKEGVDCDILLFVINNDINYPKCAVKATIAKDPSAKKYLKKYGVLDG